MKESALVNACIRWLYFHGCLAHRNNSGAFKTSYQRKDGSMGKGLVRFGFKGSGDILACSPHGRWIEVEAKVSGKGQSDEQKRRQEEVERRGGVSVLAYSLDDLETRKSEILYAKPAVD